jgi:hypothetical protein
MATEKNIDENKSSKRNRKKMKRVAGRIHGRKPKRRKI